MAQISLHNGLISIDCEALTEAQAEHAEAHIVDMSFDIQVVDDVREFAAGRCEQNARSFVAIFCEEYTRRTGSVYTLP